MKMLFLVLLTLASTPSEAMDTAVKCRSSADKVLRGIAATPALEGNFFTRAPTLRLQRRSLPDNESEIWENFTYSHPNGDNTVTVKLARGLCELREVIHNVPL